MVETDRVVTIIFDKVKNKQPHLSNHPSSPPPMTKSAAPTTAAASPRAVKQMQSLSITKTRTTARSTDQSLAVQFASVFTASAVPLDRRVRMWRAINDLHTEMVYEVWSTTYLIPARTCSGCLETAPVSCENTWSDDTKTCKCGAFLCDVCDRAGTACLVCNPRCAPPTPADVADTEAATAAEAARLARFFTELTRAKVNRGAGDLATAKRRVAEYMARWGCSPPPRANHLRHPARKLRLLNEPRHFATALDADTANLAEMTTNAEAAALAAAAAQ